MERLKAFNKILTSLKKGIQEVTKEKKKPTKGDTGKTKPKDKEKRGLSKTKGCLHQLGYLNQRAKTEDIPDECMTCKELINCLRTPSKI